MDRHVVTVFGGSGFLGRHLIRRLARAGALVRVATRDPEGAKFLKTMGRVAQIIPVYADLARPETIAAVVADATAVVNLVGVLFESGDSTFQRIHVDGARAIAAAASAAGVKRLTHVSALGADAQSPSAYAQSKAAGEAAVREAFPNAVILRPSVMFGPEDSFFNRFAGIMRLSPVLPLFGGGTSKMQPVYVADVADALMRSLGDPATAGKTYELGGPRAYTFRELMTLLLTVTGRKRLLMSVPFGLAKIPAWFLEFLPSPPLTRDQLVSLGRDNVVNPTVPGLSDLGVEPTPAEGVLPTYLARYRLPSAAPRQAV
jgi:uncharacterized protein YbjT (DUF2867 family)